jgi:catalase
MVTPEQAVDRIGAVFGSHPGRRTLHARGEYYRATFTATPEAGALCRAPHLTGAPVPTLVRLSNGSGNPHQADRVPDVRGMAVSFRPADGVVTDLLAQTAPRFPVRTPEEFVDFTVAAAQVRSKPWLLMAFLARHPYVVPTVVANARAGAIKAPRSFATTTFYAIHAYKWLDGDGGARWVRYTWLPEATNPPEPDRGDREYLHHELQQRLERAPVRFTLRVQVAADGDDPHDPTSVWKSKEHLDAGILEITAPDPARETEGEVIVFDPTRVVDGLELSDDAILRFRPLAYSVSVQRRV